MGLNLNIKIKYINFLYNSRHITTKSNILANSNKIFQQITKLTVTQTIFRSGKIRKNIIFLAPKKEYI